MTSSWPRRSASFRKAAACSPYRCKQSMMCLDRKLLEQSCSPMSTRQSKPQSSRIHVVGKRVSSQSTISAHLMDAARRHVVVLGPRLGGRTDVDLLRAEPSHEGCLKYEPMREPRDWWLVVDSLERCRQNGVVSNPSLLPYGEFDGVPKPLDLCLLNRSRGVRSSSSCLSSVALLLASDTLTQYRAALDSFTCVVSMGASDF
mmetsp:Transcript_149451/g.264255  ORF Transcript_149451/g.264255 Transcript_149451/m.264255 type:complete len:202 (+) Transcript_149451:993-1598(+)